jgi:nanoRNase/pAp phosphatase (c-di-AMP/oligoRNAs hydrolase)
MNIEKIPHFFELLRASKSVLITLPKQPRIDAIGSAVALAIVLRKMGKEAVIVCESKPAPAWQFLLGDETILDAVPQSNGFIIFVSTAQTPLEELSYHTFEDKVEVHLQPAAGKVFRAEDISFQSEKPAQDLIICLESPSLEQLGSIYEKNAVFFLDTPKVNIDNHISNEQYGTVNIVEVTASSTSEIIFELLKQAGVDSLAAPTELIDKRVATLLLAGVISETNSFQKPATTHHSFLRASELIDYGADQQEIVRNLFKTRSFSMLKIWGRAMARIKTLQLPFKTQVYFSAVTALDIQRSEAQMDDITQAFHELLTNLPDVKMLFFSVESQSDPRKTDLYFYVHPNLKLSEVAYEFGAEILSECTAKAEVQLPLAEVEESVVSALLRLKDRIGL